MHLHIDPTFGMAGDMFLAALMDAGYKLEDLRQGLSCLKLERFGLEVREVKRGGLRAMRLFIDEGEGFPPEPGSSIPAHHHADSHHGNHDHKHGHEHGHSHKHGGHEGDAAPKHAHHHDSGPGRTLPDMLRLLEESSLAASVKERAADIFRLLAEAEGQVHGKLPEQVHFHEVSGLDTIIDVVGACLAIEALGIKSISASPVAVGSGTVKCAHGLMPVPAPATSILLRGLPLRQDDCPTELCTPTGAALLRGLASHWGNLPSMSANSIGCGAGSKDISGRASILRVFIGELAGNAVRAASEQDKVAVLSCSIDDMTGEALGYALERLIAAGALDAYLRPIVMKKGRPGQELVVLCAPARQGEFSALVFRETSTFGLRVEEVSREILERKIIPVMLRGREVRVKLGFRQGKLMRVSPEYEDCKAVALALDKPLAGIMREAAELTRKDLPQE